MCGIAGFLGLADTETLRAMADAIAHRGPDGDGYFIDQAARIGLAHRRLAIIDVTDAAAQPMSSCDGRYRVTFNGEIYNYKALAADLLNHGYKFNENSDTAVIAPLYDLYGIDFLSRLDGIFAFALWDVRKQKLVVARDRFGVKPLYWFRRGGQLAFASELKALLHFVKQDPALDEAAVLGYLTRLWSAGEATPFRQVRKLLPGHVLRARQGQIEISRWHAPSRAPARPNRSFAETATAVAATLDAAVDRQCISDVPIGAFLSGGVDSSAIVAAMVATGHVPKRTYCIAVSDGSMRDEGFGDDIDYARGMAQRLGVPLSVVEVAAPTPAEIFGLPYLLDEPTADPAALYIAAIAKAARSDGIKVLLGGTGGDDVFSGYRRHRAAALRQWLGPLSRLLPSALANGSEGGGNLHRRLAKLGYLFDGTDDEFLLRSFEFNRENVALQCLSPAFAQAAMTGGDDWLRSSLRATESGGMVDRMLDLEMRGFLPDHNLNYTDKAAMAHGVEVRVPFLDNSLVELAAGIPWQMKVRWLAEKAILKRAMATRLPQGILKRKKTGLGAPVRSWVREGPLRTLIEDTIASRAFRERGIFVAAHVRTLLDDTIAGRQDGAYLLLAITVVEHWMLCFSEPITGKIGGQRGVESGGGISALSAANAAQGLGNDSQ